MQNENSSPATSSRHGQLSGESKGANSTAQAATSAENEQLLQKYLIEKMAIYLAKMSMHEMTLAVRHPSLLAVGAIYVALKICEQLKKKELINA